MGHGRATTGSQRSIHVLAPGGLEVRGPVSGAVLLRQPKRAGVLLYLLLRQALSFLRNALGSHVVINRGTSSVTAPPDRIACDAVRFEALLDTGRNKEALALYRGELGQGLHVVGAGAFDQ